VNKVCQKHLNWRPQFLEDRFLQVVTTKNEVSTEIRARTAAGNVCYFALQRILKSKSISQKAKLAIYKAIIKPIVTHASETWVLTKKDEALSVHGKGKT
jgi:hypothetical protein